VMLGLIRFTVSPANGFQVIASFKAQDFCLRTKYDIRTIQSYESGSATYSQPKKDKLTVSNEQQ
jgi:hypothetical protein